MLRTSEIPSLHIDRSTLQSWLAQRQPIEILDIRRSPDFDEWHIAEARHLDIYDELHMGSPGLLAGYAPVQAVPVILVCYVGNTSLAAASYLRSRGIEAYSLAGGMQEWSLAWNVASLPLAGLHVVQVRRVGKGCLSYLLAAGDQALVVDASLDPQVYTGLASQVQTEIIGALDTHIHADHISRGPALASQLSIPYYLPRNEQASIKHSPLVNGDNLEVGDVRLRTLATPGHTAESICLIFGYHAAFTGDTLFISAFGRPDLSNNAALTATNALALHGSLLALQSLPGDMLVFPAHTDSPVAFGSPVIAATIREVFEQVVVEPNSGEFEERILAKLPPPPGNHLHIHKMNIAGELPPFDPAILEAGANRCALR
ncbi:MAG: MBL fold metallo-hydrolase [Chloroflexi bacterium]|nr:MBL fold metallo-hydrolase [Chloroflexota bacterium]